MPDVPPPERSPFLKLLLLVNLTAKPFGELFERRFQLTLPEWRVMLAVTARPGSSSSDVADALGLDKMAVSRAVRALEKGGRLERRPDPADGRRSVLSLTREGEDLYALIMPSARDREAGLLAGLDRVERAGFDTILDKLVESARNLPGGEGDGPTQRRRRAGSSTSKAHASD